MNEKPNGRSRNHTTQSKEYVLLLLYSRSYSCIVCMYVIGFSTAVPKTADHSDGAVGGFVSFARPRLSHLPHPVVSDTTRPIYNTVDKWFSGR